MKLYKIVLSLWLISDFIFASEAAKKSCESGCGPIEHVYIKKIKNQYADEHVNSGLIKDDTNEDVPTNIVEALVIFAFNTQLIDKDGNPIIPQPSKDGTKIALPMKNSMDYQLRKSIVATTPLHDASSTSEILEKWNNLYNVSKTDIQEYAATSGSVTQDGLVLCAPCSQKKRK